MYLKEIEVAGFKSFADKLEFKLDQNITCIVGPNGSGKSNVVDAVRWVLGEQSVKSLRGDGNMSDVIFSGSKSRGASSVASVALIFDNSDHYLSVPFTEVSIKRRIYRTGENEYFLNGEKCRLKDITDLFLDSGIGKFSFNIISQGEVMRILSNSPYDRRIIFEEAARVLKYKKRKEEAIRKLERTNQNLDRVSDIIAELEGQVEPLREQSRKAKEYIQVKEDLEKYEVSLLAEEISLLTSDSEKKKARLKEVESESFHLSSSNSTGDIKTDEKRVELLKLEDDLRNKNARLLKLTEEVERLNSEKLLLKERSKLDGETDKVNQEILALNERKLALENQIFSVEKELEVEQVEENTLKDKKAKLEAEIASWNKRREDDLREYNTKSREYLETKSQISILENNIEAGGGAPSSVKAVLNNPRLTGIHSIFSNLVEVTDTYLKAFEVATTASKNAIVVNREEDAKGAISYLKEQRLGRATFYPISSMKPKSVDSNSLQILQKEEGFVHILENLVSCEEKFSSVVSSQLGNIIVASSFDAATRISKKLSSRYRVVTLDGEIIQVGGSITGGSLSLQKSIASLKQELTQKKALKVDLKGAILELDTSLKEMESLRKDLEEKSYDIQSHLIAKQEKLRLKLETLMELKESLAGILRDISSYDAVLTSSTSEKELQVIEEYSSKLNEKNELVSEIKKMELSQGRLKQEIEEMDAKSRENNAKTRKLEQEAKSLEIALSQNDLKLDQYLLVLNEEYSMTYEKARKDYPLELELDEQREKVGHLKSMLKKIGMVNIDSIEEFERVNERYTFLTNQRGDLENAKQSLYEIISEMDEVVKQEFISTFEKVRVEFKSVFTSLFGGGTADLKLTDEDNLLETGVEIIASPPGKKLTTISLLSGGEKTLTAISLLFAILNVQTVPFCLFDEVEAALDEANVDNFGKYLDHYKDKTQFLLITHKKKTMEYAKTLYGITMQESGVSKLVSVKLDSSVSP